MLLFYNISLIFFLSLLAISMTHHIFLVFIIFSFVSSIYQRFNYLFINLFFNFWETNILYLKFLDLYRFVLRRLISKIGFISKELLHIIDNIHFITKSIVNLFILIFKSLSRISIFAKYVLIC